VALDICFTVDAKGLGLSLLTSPVKGSDFEKLNAEMKPTDDPLLALLPKEQYLLSAGGTILYSEYGEKFSGKNQFSKLLKQFHSGEELSESSLTTLDEEGEKLMKSVRRWAFSASALTDSKDGMFAATAVFRTKNSKAFVESMRKMWKALVSVTDKKEVSDVAKAIVHTQDAETIEGHKVDTVTVDMDQLGEALGAEEDWLKTVATVLGKDLVVRFGSVDGDHVVVAFGGGQERYATVCKGLTSGQGGLSKDAGITALSSQLPSPRVSEAYIDVSNAIRIAKRVLKAMGEDEEFPFEAPNISAPVAMASSLQGNVSRVDLVIPMKLIQAGKAAFDKFQSAAEVSFDDEDDDAADDEDEEASDDDEGDDDEGDDDEEEASEDNE